MGKGMLFVISGPSGAGKDTVVNQAIERLRKEIPISRIITYTTRLPRDNETNGKDYIFVSHEDFSRKEKDGFFLETTKYLGHGRGSPALSGGEMELGKSFVLVVDIDGAKSVKKAFRDALMIWVSPPDAVALKHRLSKRGTESDAQIKKRVERAKDEMEEAHKSRLFDYVLVNDIFDQSVEELELLIKKALKKD